LHLVVEVQQRLLAHVLAPAPHVLEHLGRVAHDAQRGRHHQRPHQQQEPPGRVHRVQAGLAEDLEPERAELVDVVRGSLALLHHRADDGRDRDHRQQGDGETHGGNQFNNFADDRAAGVQLDAGGAGAAHALKVLEKWVQAAAYQQKGQPAYAAALF
jgi:hypothetical protein